MWTLIDDVINTVNEISYASIESVEVYMRRMSPEALGFQSKPGTIRDVDDDGRTLMTEEEEQELMKGFHQLETLVENTVDINFDRFELFVLRNVLVVKEDLVGWVRLEHHKVQFCPFPYPVLLQLSDRADLLRTTGPRLLRYYC